MCRGSAAQLWLVSSHRATMSRCCLVCCTGRGSWPWGRADGISACALYAVTRSLFCSNRYSSHLRPPEIWGTIDHCVAITQQQHRTCTFCVEHHRVDELPIFRARELMLPRRLYVISTCLLPLYVLHPAMRAARGLSCAAEWTGARCCETACWAVQGSEKQNYKLLMLNIGSMWAARAESPAAEHQQHRAARGCWSPSLQNIMWQQRSCLQTSRLSDAPLVALLHQHHAHC